MFLLLTYRFRCHGVYKLFGVHACFYHLLLGYNLQVSAGIAPAQHSNYTCVKAVITDKFDVQTCNTGS